MGFDEQSTDKAILQEIGERLEQLRLNRNLIRTDLAEQAGISRNTIERIESGDSVQLINLIRLCRALGILSRFEAVFPLHAPSPVAQLKLRGKSRQRASKKRSNASDSWSWGDKE
ncbi:MAG: helix-turn-helix transcriptional regulator [Pyrinomonadaceae bacterium]